MPSALKLAGEFKSRGLEVLAITFREDPATVRRVVADRRYDARGLIDATGDVTGRVYGVFGPPTTYLVDREGRLVARGVGPRNWESPAARNIFETLVGQR